jgi:hypothetical protein
VGKIVVMVGVFGAVMALFGSVVAMMVGGTGAFGSSDGAGELTGSGLISLLAVVVGFIGALVGRSRLAVGATLMLASSAAGLVLITWYYVAGAILFSAAAYLALRAGPDDA